MHVISRALALTAARLAKLRLSSQIFSAPPPAPTFLRRTSNALKMNPNNMIIHSYCISSNSQPQLSSLTVRQWFARARSSPSNQGEGLRELLDATLALAEHGNANMITVIGILLASSAPSNPSSLALAAQWLARAAEVDHPFATYALGILRLTGSSNAVLDPERGLDEVEMVSARKSDYYIDLDNLDAFLGAAAPSAAASAATEPTSFDFAEWLRRETKKHEKRRAREAPGQSVERIKGRTKSKAKEKRESLSGDAFAVDAKAGLALLERASELGSVEAMLGFYYLDSSEEVGRELKALAALSHASALGSAVASFRIAQLLFDATHGDAAKDQSAARSVLGAAAGLDLDSNSLAWFKRAADAGHAAGNFWVGYFVHQSLTAEEPVPWKAELITAVGAPSLDEAVRFLTRAHEGGDKQATMYLARLYRDESSPLFNIQKSSELLDVAASEPSPVPEALHELADAYLRGIDGRSQDEDRALELFKAAGRLGHADALCNAGALFYHRGDYERAFYAYQNAALHGSIDAHRNLAHLYEHGLGVAKSAKAAAYHAKASAQVDAHHDMLDALEEAHKEHAQLAATTRKEDE